MKTKITVPTKVKITSVFIIIFLSAFGLGYSVVKWIITDVPDLTVLLPVFLVSLAILVNIVWTSIKINHH